MTVKVGIIGPGDMGRIHVDALRRAGSEVAAVAGVTLHEARAFADEFGIPAAFASVHDLCAHAEVDAVVVTSPTPIHSEHTLAALASRLHVLCEIPFATSLESAVEVVEAANRAERNVMVAQTLRFCAPYAFLRKLIEQGDLSVEHLVSRRLMLRQRDEGWSGKPRGWTDSVLWHHGGHQLDLALWLLDVPQTRAGAVVHGSVGRRWALNGEPMDVSISVVTDDARLGSLSLSYHSRQRTEDCLVISPDVTYAVVDGRLIANGDVVVDSLGDDEMKREAILAQDLEFIRSIEDGRAPTVSASDLLGLSEALGKLAERV